MTTGFLKPICGFLLSLVFLPLSATGAAYLVTNPSDTGAGSLREAITSANVSSDSDFIQFQENLGTITLQTNLIIQNPVFIDGRGQTLAGQGSNSFVLLLFWPASSGSTVTGMTLWNGLNGVELRSNDNWVYGNCIGMDWQGNSHPNGQGVVISAGGRRNLIGGATPSCRNYIAGSTLADIYIYQGEDNTIAGNWVGLHKNGSSVVSGHPAIHLHYAMGNKIGGSSPAERNMVASNNYAIYINLGAEGNTLTGNWIGVYPNGASTGNQYFTGIYCRGNHNWLGMQGGAGNLISGWDLGVDIEGDFNGIYGNTITSSASAGIRLTSGGNNSKPRVTAVYAYANLVSGTAQPNDYVELFRAEPGSGYDGGSLEYLGATTALADGRFYLWESMPVGHYVTVLASSSSHRTSVFSPNALVSGQTAVIPSPTATSTPTPTHTGTCTSTATPSHTATISLTASPSTTATPSPASTAPAEASKTQTTTATPITTPTPVPSSTPTVRQDNTMAATPSPEIDLPYGRFVQPHPNPASDHVAFVFAKDKRGSVIIRVYNLSGELIAEVTGRLAGESGQTIVWNTGVVAPGIYFAQVVIDGVPMAKQKIAISR